MGIDDFKVTFKSTPENWFKEYIGLKCNTVRKFKSGEYDTRQELLTQFLQQPYNLWVEIVNTETSARFQRCVTDVTVYEGMYIISWEN